MFQYAAMAMQAIGMLGGASVSRIQGKAAVKQAEEQTKQSKAKQEELNANSQLARSLQRINNDRIMRATDKTFAAAASNLSRNRAATQTNNIMTQVAQAEAAGAYAANVASKGIGGGSVEAIETTMELRDSLKNQLTANAQGLADYDAVQTLAGIVPAGWQQQDMTVLSGNQSAAAAVPTVTGGFNWASAIGNSPTAMKGFADLLSNWGSTPTGSSGTGLTAGGGLGLKAPSSFFNFGSTTNI